jgi:hypothetical protein
MDCSPTLLASALAGQLAEQRASSAGCLSRELILQLLVEEWHGALKQRWGQLRDDSDAFAGWSVLRKSA